MSVSRARYGGGGNGMVRVKKNHGARASAAGTSSRGVGRVRVTTKMTKMTTQKPRLRRSVCVRAADAQEPSAGPKLEQVVKPLNGDPFVGMLETPVTSSPIVANYLSNLPAYRIAVSPLLRGVEIGLAHGFFIVGPFIKFGPLRNSEAAEVAGCLSGAGLILILTACLTMYGVAQFQSDETPLKNKTLTGRTIISDPAKTPEGWSKFSAGFLFGGLSGVAWAYIMTQTLPFYS